MELIESMTHFDTKFLQTFTDLAWRPGLVIKNYNADKRARYFPPVRIYFFTSAICFLILSLSFHDKLETASEKLSDNLKHNVKDTTGAIRIQINSSDTDSSMYKKLAEMPNLTYNKLDSVYTANHKKNNWLDNHILFTLIKLRNGELSLVELFHRFVKYFSYALFILMPLFAGFLKLFYRKRNYYYSEFLVFSIYFHTFIFGVLGIYVLLEKLLDFKSTLLTVVLLIAVPIYLALSLKRVFNDKTIKTILKTLSLTLVYFFCLLIIFTLLILVSFV